MSWIEKFGMVPDKPLYHYTSIGGLLGIFKDKKLWATSIFHLNDQEELRQAMNLFLDALKEFDRQNVTGRAVPVNGVADDPQVLFLDCLYELFDIAEQFGVLVCSFSEAEDLLSQWRGYCNGGCGFSIGFDYTLLKPQIERQGFVLAKCIYNLKKQIEIIVEYITTSIKKELQSIAEENNIKEEDIENRASATYIDILQVLPILKNNCFREEQEWRMVSPLVIYDYDEKPMICFRSGKTSVIPYYEFELESGKGEGLPLNSIVIGPTTNKTESHMGLKVMLTREKMWKRVAVRHSKIPYREI